jgi:hypothetical protein
MLGFLCSSGKEEWDELSSRLGTAASALVAQFLKSSSGLPSIDLPPFFL